MIEPRLLTADGFVPGTSVAAREHGRVAAPRVVLLHALGLDGFSFDAVAAELADQYHLVAIDLPGHGRSPGPADIPTAVARVAPAVRVLAADGPVHLLGHSFGGAVASELSVARRPDVASLVIVASPPSGFPVFAERAEQVDIPGTLLRWFRPEVLVADGADVRYARDRLAIVEPATWRQAWTSFAEWPGSSVLRGTDAPLLAVAGAQDQSTPVAALAEVLRAAGRETSLRVVLDPAAHMLVLETPSALARVLRTFWSSLSPPPPTFGRTAAPVL